MKLNKHNIILNQKHIYFRQNRMKYDYDHLILTNLKKFIHYIVIIEPRNICHFLSLLFGLGFLSDLWPALQEAGRGRNHTFTPLK